MCLVVIGLRVHPRYPLIVLSNRDEVYGRPTQPAHGWDDAPIFGGRDLEAGGTWLGVARSKPGLPFALVTNVRSPTARRVGRSRGALVSSVLTSGIDAIEREAYPAFNLLFGDAAGVYSADESPAASIALSAGIHGLSNARVDVPWPKVTRVQTALTRLVAESTESFDLEAALAILRDAAPAAVSELPNTGVEQALELALSSPFIALPGYGTRASTVLLYDRDGSIRFVEQSYGPDISGAARVDVRIESARDSYTSC